MLTAEQDATKTRGQTLQAAHALRKSAGTGRGEPNLTEHVAPRGAGESCGCASECDWLWRPRDAIAPYPFLAPRLKKKQTLNTSRQVIAAGRVGTDGARGNQGACAYLPEPTAAGPRAAPLTGPGILALLEHPASHWRPGLIT